MRGAVRGVAEMLCMLSRGLGALELRKTTPKLAAGPGEISDGAEEDMEENCLLRGRRR